MLELMDQIQDLSKQFFMKLLSVLEFIELNNINNENSIKQSFQSRFIFVNEKNKLWNFFLNSSRSLFNYYLDQFAEHLKDSMNFKASELYSQILECFCLVDAKLTLSKIMPLIQDKLLSKDK